MQSEAKTTQHLREAILGRMNRLKAQNRRPEMTPGDVATLANISEKLATRILDAMHAEGLVSREKDTGRGTAFYRLIDPKPVEKPAPVRAERILGFAPFKAAPNIAARYEDAIADAIHRAHAKALNRVAPPRHAKGQAENISITKGAVPERLRAVLKTDKWRSTREVADNIGISRKQAAKILERQLACGNVRKCKKRDPQNNRVLHAMWQMVE